MGFNQCNNNAGGLKKRSSCGKNFRLSCPARINGNNIHRFRQLRMQSVLALHDHDAWILAKCPCQYAVTRVNGIDFCRAIAQQAVDKATHIAAQVGGNKAGDTQ